MKDTIKNMMDELLEKDLKNIENLEVGGKERAQAVEDFIKLHKAQLEFDKFEFDMDEKMDQRTINLHKIEVDKKINEKKIEQQKKDNRFKEFANLLNLGVSGTFYVILALKGFKFEQFGTIASSTAKRTIGDAFSFFRIFKK